MRLLILVVLTAVLTIALLLVSCGPPKYDERNYASAATRLDTWIARADEPLKSELASRKAAFDQRMTTLPTEATARSNAIRAIFDEAMQTSATYEARILDDLRGKARPALAASGLVGHWAMGDYTLTIQPDGRIHYARRGGLTYVSGEVIRVDTTGLLLTVYQLGRDDRVFDIEHAPRMEGDLRVIRVNGRVLRFWP